MKDKILEFIRTTLIPAFGRQWVFCLNSLEERVDCIHRDTDEESHVPFEWIIDRHFDAIIDLLGEQIAKDRDEQNT